MRILVCVKPVPDPEQYGKIQIDPETKRLMRDGIPMAINPADKNALEEAIRIRDAFGGSITVLSMTLPSARDKIMESLAMGADEAYLLSDAAFGGSDTYATSCILAEAVKKIAEETGGSFDLILAGSSSADGATSHVPAQLAEWLKLPHLCNVNRIEVADKANSIGAAEGAGEGGCVVRAWKKTEDGRLLFEGSLPAVISVTRDLNKPRLVSAMGIIKARKKPLTLWSNEELKLDPVKIGLEGSPTKSGKTFEPDLARQAEDLGSDPEEIADKILSIMKKAGV
ncbi:MAG: electron transfer flavoprotein subunit beta/FixA family protein [Bacillota bacterium]|nr:electron transfer flavoprotein subunit beta/FixA family protein [Bacillota bacterium]